MDLQITFRKLEPSSAFKAVVQEEAEALEAGLGPQGKCRVVVEGLPHTHQGRRFSILIEAGAAGSAAIRVQEEGPESNKVDPYQVIHSAFRKVRQRLASVSELERHKNLKRDRKKTA